MGKKKKSKNAPGSIVNRKANFNYHLHDRMEAGMVLVGSEVKSLRDGRANITDAYASIRDEELWLHNLHISHYAPAAQFNHEPERKRKLLLKRKELLKLVGKLQEKKMTLVPTKIYFNSRGIAKCELALATGKQSHDKRQDMKKRDSDREMRRAVKR